MRNRTAVLIAMLAMAPLGARAADLVVWWDEGRYAEEDEAVREIVAAFEQDTGKQIELVFQSEEDHPQALAAALAVRQPPDFAFGYLLINYMDSGRSTTGSWTSPTPAATSWTSSSRMCSPS